MNFISIFISSSDPNLVRKKSVKKTKEKKTWPYRFQYSSCVVYFFPCSFVNSINSECDCDIPLVNEPSKATDKTHACNRRMSLIRTGTILDLCCCCCCCCCFLYIYLLLLFFFEGGVCCCCCCCCFVYFRGGGVVVGFYAQPGSKDHTDTTLWF